MKKIILFALLICLIGTSCSTESKGSKDLVVASYNLRCKNKGDDLRGNAWTQRCPHVLDLIKYNGVDIWGAQEALLVQIEDVVNGLGNVGYIGVAREDGKEKGEYSPIFYRNDKFDLLQSGTFWLSENTEEPNVGWDAELPRVCTWGQFKDKNNGAIIWFFNTHMDHRGVKAREESAKLVLDKIKESCSPTDIVVFTGDFNSDQNSEAYQTLTASDLLKDSYELADIKYTPVKCTFNDYNPHVDSDRRIDHIFVSPRLTVDKFAIITDNYRGEALVSDSLYIPLLPQGSDQKQSIVRYPSDHFPIIAHIAYN